MSVVIGWDIGGAHLKAARAEGGRVLDVVQVASPLRLGVERVADAFDEAKAVIGSAPRHIVTMTAELADTFASRREGVERLARVAAQQLAGSDVLLYAGRAGFITPDTAGKHVEDIASANWHASASLVARSQATALFVDMGSTTTDIVPVSGGAIAAHGYTDAERLAAGELVYAGLVRGFVMATANRAPFGGQWTTLINENFATMADVHRILEILPDGTDKMTTADGRDKTVAASRARLARMVGRDATDGDDAEWLELARWFAEAQIRAVTDGAMLVLSHARLPATAPIVGAGIGAAVTSEVARRLGRAYLGFGTLLDTPPAIGELASQCAPAAALAVLASRA
jgi:(4-(4-[2-(gamma-L-glutamylamino)ethyl]phenoxymethyl)furan-2-yl)methanamine synthase